MRDKDDKHGAFFTVKDDHIQLIGVETDKLHPSFTQVRDDKGWLRISGSAGGPAVFSQISTASPLPRTRPQTISSRSLFLVIPIFTGPRFRNSPI